MEARRRLEQILEQKPEQNQARERLGLLEFQASQSARLGGDREASEAHLRRALELMPKLVPAGLDLSDLSMSKSPPDLVAARAALHGVLAAEPGNAEAKRRLALLETRFGPER